MSEKVVEEKIEPLRPRGELETMLALQIATGVITSVEDMEAKGQIDALEYSAQMLFDNVRMRIACKNELPTNIVRHLEKDRNSNIRLKIVERHPGQVSQEGIENFLRAMNEAHNADKSIPWEIEYAQNSLLKYYHAQDNDNMIVRMLKIKIKRSFDPPDFLFYPFEKLRGLPKLCDLVSSNSPFTANGAGVHLVHPDEDVRLAEAHLTLNMSIPEMKDHFFIVMKHIENKYPFTHIKTELLNTIARDPSQKIRRLLIEHTTHEPTLKMMTEHEPDALIKSKAIRKLAKLNKRAEYAQKYHAKRKAEAKLKLQKEREARDAKNTQEREALIKAGQK